MLCFASLCCDFRLCIVVFCMFVLCFVLVGHRRRLQFLVSFLINYDILGLRETHFECKKAFLSKLGHNTAFLYNNSLDKQYQTGIITLRRLLAMHDKKHRAGVSQLKLKAITKINVYTLKCSCASIKSREVLKENDIMKRT